MKKLKIKKRMTSFLMLVTMAVSIVGVLPKSVAYADETVELPDYDFRIDDNKMDGSFQLFKWNPSCAGADTVSFWNPEKKEFCDAVISTSPLTDSYTYYKYSATTDGGSILMNTSENKCHSGSFEARGKKYYFVWYDSKLSNLDYGIGVKKGICFGSKEFVTEDSEKRICEYIIGTLPTSFTVIGEDGVDTDAIPNGTADRPFEDKKIGHLILNNQKGQDVLPENRDTDAVSSYQVFKWKSKTDTGFSLTKNKYARTYVEAKVESRCVIYKHMNSYYVKNNFTSKKIEEDNEVKEKFKNFGESATISKTIQADKLEYVLSFDKIDELLPKTAKEWHNDFYVGHNYRVYFRVLCTDSLTVIPDENDNSWHSGGWSYVDFSLDGVVSGNGDGHFDNDGVWITDNKKDDINNGGRDTFIDDDAAKDDRENSSNWGRKDPESDSGLDTSNIKGFMNQVGNVPKAIGKLFTFLPDWVTTFIAFGFVLLIALMIIKAIRG